MRQQLLALHCILHSASAFWFPDWADRPIALNAPARHQSSDVLEFVRLTFSWAESSINSSSELSLVRRGGGHTTRGYVYVDNPLCMSGTKSCSSSSFDLSLYPSGCALFFPLQCPSVGLDRELGRERERKGIDTATVPPRVATPIDEPLVQIVFRPGLLDRSRRSEMKESRTGGGKGGGGDLGPGCVIV